MCTGATSGNSYLPAKVAPSKNGEANTLFLGLSAMLTFPMLEVYRRFLSRRLEIQHGSTTLAKASRFGACNVLHTDSGAFPVAANNLACAFFLTAAGQAFGLCVVLVCSASCYSLFCPCPSWGISCSLHFSSRSWNR